MKRTWANSLVAAQIILMIALIVEPQGSLWPRWGWLIALAGILIFAGLAIAVLGIVTLGKSLTPSPIPKDGATLITSGIYAWVRNPIYSGLLFGGFGLVLIGASWWHCLTWLVLLALFGFKARWEERMLAQAHSFTFREYARKTGRFVPGIGKLGS